MKHVLCILVLTMIVLNCNAGNIAIVKGLHITQVSTNSAGAKYYQDTMINSMVPSPGYDGGCMDLAVLKGFVGFGQTINDDYVNDNLVYSGPAVQIAKGSFGDTNNVYALDSSVYEILNPTTDNGSDPEITSGQGDYITAAGMQKSVLDMGLEPGVNRFTIIGPAAMEIGDQGMLGLFIYGTNSSSLFVEGSAPSLAAVDINNPSQMDGDGYAACGYRGGDATYFQAADVALTGTTLQKEFCGYLARVTYFNIVGRNDAAVNPYGMSSAGAVGYVCDHWSQGVWSIGINDNQAIAYLEITVDDPPPEPHAPQPIVNITAWQTNATIKVQNIGVGSFDYSASSSVAWLVIEPLALTGTVSLENIIPFSLDKSGLADGDHVAIITLNCGSLGNLEYTINVKVAGGVASVFGLHITQISPNTVGMKYYQDTMFGNHIPSVNFDGNMDVGLFRGFYGFGNTAVIDSDDYIKDNILDTGAAIMQNMGSFYGTTTVYRVDPSEYEILNPVSGVTASVPGAAGDYIGAAGLTKEALFMTLYPGLNRFTFVCPAAMEIGDAGMIGLYLLNSGEMPDFSEGQAPSLAAIDENAGLTDGRDHLACGFHGGQAGYFQLATNFLSKTSLATQINGYRVEITYFNVAGRNDLSVNPYGLTSPGSVGYVGSDYYGNWSVTRGGDHAIGYLEIMVDNPPPLPFLPKTSVNMGYWRSEANFVVENKGSSNFFYSASVDVDWLSLSKTNGNVVLNDSIDFVVDRSTLANGSYQAMITLACAGLENQTFKVDIEVGEVEGVVNVYGIYLAQLKPPGAMTFYQDTMIDSLTPNAAFDSCMDLTILKGFYRFGDLQFNYEDDYAVHHLEDPLDIFAQYVDRGYFLTNIYAFALDPEYYNIVNGVTPKGEEMPEIKGNLAEYIEIAELQKSSLLLSLQEGINRFTLLSPAAGEISFDGLAGLFLFENGTVPNFKVGDAPTVAAIDVELGLDAKGTNAVGFIDGDAAYFQPSIGAFEDSTLLAHVGIYDVTVTYFNVVDQDIPEVNPMGLASPAAPGYVASETISYPGDMQQWGIRNGAYAAVAYLELTVEQIPEPACLAWACLALFGLLIKRSR